MSNEKPNFLWPTNVHCVSVRGFWEGLQEGRLLARECCTCCEVFFPPRSHCPQCLGNDLTWKELSGEGYLHSWTEVSIAGPEFETPFLLGLVDLVEGIGRIASRIVGAEAHRLRCGMPVKIVCVDVQEGLCLTNVTI